MAAVSEEQTFDIRQAIPADWPGIWAILEPVIRAGETFTWDRDTSEEAARSKWIKDAPGQTFVAVARDSGGRVQGGTDRPSGPLAGQLSARMNSKVS